MKVIIDTNILIESTGDEFSYSKKIIDLVLSGEIEAYATNPIIRENKLLLKKAVPNPKQKAFLENYFAVLKEIKIKHHRQIIELDSEDDKFINAALSAEAGYIITNDDHLLFYDEYEGIKIMKPENFYLEIKSEDSKAGRKMMLDLMR